MSCKYDLWAEDFQVFLKKNLAITTWILLIVLTLKIPSSQTKVASLCYYRVSLFMPTIATCRYGYNPKLKTIVRKLSIVFY
jgi:hypothetical protein